MSLFIVRLSTVTILLLNSNHFESLLEYEVSWTARQLWALNPRRMLAFYAIKTAWQLGRSVGRDSSVGIATGYVLDGPGIEFRWQARFSTPIQTGPGAHPASCTMGTRSFPGGKEWPGCDADPSPPSSAIGHERVELYVCSPYGPYGLYRASVHFTCTIYAWNHDILMYIYYFEHNYFSFFLLLFCRKYQVIKRFTFLGSCSSLVYH